MDFTPDSENVGDGLQMMVGMEDGAAAAGFFDPQYCGVLEHLGTDGSPYPTRQRQRAALPFMRDGAIRGFVDELFRVVRPQGHLFLWMDKYHLTNDSRAWFRDTEFELVDLITWNKDAAAHGMGYRLRSASEFLVVLQKPPRRAKDVWKDHAIRDVWTERVKSPRHPHHKPYGLLRRLVECVTEPGDLVVDPCAGSFVTMRAALDCGRRFMGTDLRRIPQGGLF